MNIQTTEPTYHHVGLLVSDIHRAVAWFSESLGIRFREPTRVTSHRRGDPWRYGDDEPHEMQSHVSFSIDGPPYYELVEGIDEGQGLQSLSREGVGLHHVGLYVPDVEAVVGDLERQGIRVEGRVLAPDGSTLVCWTERHPVTGLRVEYMHELMRAAIRGWIEGGVAPETASFGR